MEKMNREKNKKRKKEITYLTISGRQQRIKVKRR